ncbi:MAG: hypothetical protein M1570_13280 [Chloroflexi bacterium]|nr:hypothetical protein [Chloroflexota bacterium]
MSTAAVQPPSPGWKFGFLWVLATGVGALVGPVFAFPVNLTLVALLGVTAPVPGTPTEQAMILTADAMGASMLFVGLGMGFAQWLLLRKYLEHSAGWILATGIAMFLEGLFRWSFPPDIDSALIGPLTIPAGAILLAVCQWFVLRRRVPRAVWWVILCIAGWVPTLAFALVAINVPVDYESPVAAVIIATGTILPFAVAAGGMVWLLRQTALTSQAAA